MCVMWVVVVEVRGVKRRGEGVGVGVVEMMGRGKQTLLHTNLLSMLVVLFV